MKTLVSKQRSARRDVAQLVTACCAAMCLTWSAMAIAQTVPPPPAPSPKPLLLTRLQTLGQQLVSDRNLSEPAGTACVSCHTAQTGFANNHGSLIGVALGSRPGAVGLRNAMSQAYQSFVPPFHFRVVDGDTDAVGGHFWDGRADTMALQALGPFLASAEMNNPNAVAVVKKVAKSGYANLMREEFGSKIFDKPDLAFQNMGVAIAAFEATSALQPFSSKYDMVVQGKTKLAANEERGMQLFMDTKRANCASCHLMKPTSGKPEDSLFTDFAYYATGIPRNKLIPDNANPGFYDLGLCGPKRTRPALGANVPGNISIEKFCGTFRMVSLRNVANRQAFMHNGFFKDLHDVVAFYSTRNSDPKRWYGSTGIPNDLPVAYQTNIVNDRAPFDRPKSAGPLLNQGEIQDIVAFLGTLSDGYVLPPRAPILSSLR
ncbi:cytochrome-c peroxidase [Actimicrobium sp. CCI2.3]|uniref:cytochrome-c peroxidase n=1 Tax=Actimicrobium sp. CCI2.3 TaxID=3048616 RepID=UPI002AB524E7|nr:cytochrome c peroxidase [Actimicrobium sp. CCI2.3]MDY7574787.1 cytochrome c peroxidase [Actimicrobium sp. CCI2.3]MEB0020252.1 cytochrome c peroxidase [Actimicrobium sp. CCI2.3]